MRARIILFLSVYIHRFLKSKHDIKNEKRDNTGRCALMQLLDNYVFRPRVGGQEVGHVIFVSPHYADMSM